MSTCERNLKELRNLDRYKVITFSPDPFEQWNRVSLLTASERSYLHDQLEHLKGCKGTWDCTVGSAREAMPQFQQHQRYASKRKYSETFGKSRKKIRRYLQHMFDIENKNYFSRRNVFTFGITNYTRKRTWQFTQKTEKVTKVSISSYFSKYLKLKKT